MSDISRDDLKDIQRGLEKIAERLTGPAFTANPARSLEEVSSKLDRVISELREISGKLDRR